jgi:hypothetical protein
MSSPSPIKGTSSEAGVIGLLVMGRSVAQRSCTCTIHPSYENAATTTTAVTTIPPLHHPIAHRNVLNAPSTSPRVTRCSPTKEQMIEQMKREKARCVMRWSVSHQRCVYQVVSGPAAAEYTS